jgi:hypothetical protein
LHVSERFSCVLSSSLSGMPCSAGHFLLKRLHAIFSLSLSLEGDRPTWLHVPKLYPLVWTTICSIKDPSVLHNVFTWMFQGCFFKIQFLG